MISSSTFIPLSTGFYHAPHLRFEGKEIDIGAFAEAFIYYDRVIIDIDSDSEFVKFVNWFNRQDNLNDLVSLLRDNTITLFYKSFLSGAVKNERTGNYGVWNLVQPEHEQEHSFVQLVLESDKLAEELGKTKSRDALIQAASDVCVEVKANQFKSAIENARYDYSTPQGSAFLLQIFLDEIYTELGYHKVPSIQANIRNEDKRKVIIFNFNFEIVNQYLQNLGLDMTFEKAMPLNGAVVGSQALWSAALLESDLYCSAPLTSYAEFKLEQGSQAVRTAQIVDQLVEEVAFPDVRKLVNQGRLGFREIMQLRKNATHFRQWLQEESQLDRNAVIYYHQEVAQRSGWTKGIGNILSITGRISSVTLGAGIGNSVAGPFGAMAGAAVGATANEGLTFLFDIGNKLSKGWKPAVFGELADNTIKNALKKSKTEEW